ncbi:MAG: hypothetical protein QOD81_2531 [Solirubrobacteraceae bacterium]|jgi:hypothetical protein|nr:hypothetical protein [Solirubrobacteraceae bacterium]
MLTIDQALEIANRRQRQGLHEAVGLGHAIGEPVGFLHRPTARGSAFEAVALASARSYGIVDLRGALRQPADARPR